PSAGLLVAERAEDSWCPPPSDSSVLCSDRGSRGNCISPSRSFSAWTAIRFPSCGRLSVGLSSWQFFTWRPAEEGFGVDIAALDSEPLAPSGSEATRWCYDTLAIVAEEARESSEPTIGSRC